LEPQPAQIAVETPARLDRLEPAREVGIVGDRDVLEAVEPPAPRPRGREPGAGPRPPRRPEENRRDERREEGPLERPRRIPQVGVEELEELATRARVDLHASVRYTTRWKGLPPHQAGSRSGSAGCRKTRCTPFALPTGRSVAASTACGTSSGSAGPANSSKRPSRQTHSLSPAPCSTTTATGSSNC